MDCWTVNPQTYSESKFSAEPKGRHRKREIIFIELMTSDRQLKASRRAGN